MIHPLPFTRPSTSPQEVAYLQEALGRGHVSGDGPFTARASALLKAWSGAEVLLTTSCTHALELAALLMDLGPGDEVALPSYTFSSTANAFALRGARLRFADVDLDTFSMELPQLQAALTARTKVAIQVHYGGVGRDVAQSAELCQRRGVQLVEDNAHGLFAAASGGRPMGSFGRVSALSFHGTKNISCGEGGALVFNDPALYRRALTLREKGTDRTLFLRGEVDKYTWRELGSSWLPSDLLAAVLTAQLERAEHTQARRHRVWEAYRGLLEPQEGRLGLRLQRVPAGAQHPAHVLALLLPEEVERGPILAQLKAQGIGATSHYEPLHLAPAALRCADEPPHLPNTARLARSLLRLPLFADMGEDDAERAGLALVSTLERALRKETT